MTQSVLVLARAGARAQALAACVARLGETWNVRIAEPSTQSALLGPWPALILLDLTPEEPLALVHRVARQFEGAPLVVSGAVEDARAMEAALQAGALSYLPHSYTPDQAGLVLRLAADGLGHRPHTPPPRSVQPHSGTMPVRDEVVPISSADPLLDMRLTPKQVEVLSHAAEGLSNKQIAARVNISIGTVKLHMTEIYRRLNVDRRGEAIALAQSIQRVRAQQMQRGEDGKEILDWLLPHVNHRRHASGEIIFRKGDPGTELYYLQRGKVVLEEIGVEMTDGDTFGEIGLFAPDHSRTCTARCATDVDLFCLTSEQVKSIYYLNPRFALHVITLVARRLLADRNRAS